MAMYEQEMIKYLKVLAAQLQNQQVLVLRVESAVRGISNGGCTKTVPFGIKDISTAQLYDAYRRGLNMEQLEYLSNHKYTQEQIEKKLQRCVGGNM